MFLTLVVVPVMYKIMDSMMAKFGWGKLEKKKHIREQMVAQTSASMTSHNNHKKCVRRKKRDLRR